MNITKREILAIANAGYPDDRVALAYDPVNDTTIKGEAGDTLAEFVVTELRECLADRGPEEDQFAEAIRVMDNAADELTGVVDALYAAQMNPKKRKEALKLVKGIWPILPKKAKSPKLRINGPHKGSRSSSRN